MKPRNLEPIIPMQQTITSTTDNAIKAIVNFYKEQGKSTNFADWHFIKKYKDPHGRTARDFIHKGGINLYGISCCALYEDSVSDFNILPETYFSKQARSVAGWVIFDYCLLQSADKLYFGFLSKKGYRKLPVSTLGFLEQRFKELFNTYTLVLENEGFFIYEFQNSNPFDTIHLLEQDRFSYLENVVNKKALENFNQVLFDINLIDFNRLSYDMISTQKAEDKFLFIISNSKNRELYKYEIGIIYKLLDFIPIQNFSFLFNIINGFKHPSKETIDRIMNFKSIGGNNPLFNFK